MIEPSLVEALLLAAVAFAAGTVDAIAGGGGLLTVPALLAAGLPPHQALGTNKGQSVFGAAAATVRYWRSGLIDRRRAPLSFLFGLAGAFAGAALVLAVRPEVLEPLVLAMLLGVAVFFAFRRTPQLHTTRWLVRHRAVVLAALALIIGAYDGFFGPGTGTFLIVAYVALLGAELREASANAKVVNFASNLASVCLFAWNGKILWAYALPMAGAQLLGGWFGAHLTVRGGEALVRRVVLAVVLALSAKLAWDLVGG